MPTKAFACICVHIFCTIYESGVLAQVGGGVGGGRIVYGPKTSDLCLSNKKEISEIKSSRTNFLKMIITWAIFDAFIWKCAAVSASFCFCSSEK